VSESVIEVQVVVDGALQWHLRARQFYSQRLLQAPWPAVETSEWVSDWVIDFLKCRVLWIAHCTRTPAGEAILVQKITPGAMASCRDKRVSLSDWFLEQQGVVDGALCTDACWRGNSDPKDYSRRHGQLSRQASE
jgi:hypothetical protein